MGKAFCEREKIILNNYAVEFKLIYDTNMMIWWYLIHIIKEMALSSTLFLRGHMPKCGVLLFCFNAETKKKFCTSVRGWIMKQKQLLEGITLPSYRSTGGSAQT